MEQVIASSPGTAIPSENTVLDHKTPPKTQPVDQNSPISANDSRKIGTPDRLKVPKAFKYPERYTSPTDLMISPVSKGLLARSRKTAPLLPPTKTLNKIEDSKFLEVDRLQI